MKTRLTLEERIRCVKFFYMYAKTSSIQRAWKKEFGSPPSRKTIAAVNKKFTETGSVADLCRSGRPKTSRTEATIALVQEALIKDPTKSIRNLSSELGVNKAAIHRIKQDSEKRKSTLRLENKKLKEKIVELSRKLSQLEGKSSSSEPQRQVSSTSLKSDVIFDEAKAQIVEPVNSQQVATIICTSEAPSSYLSENSPLTTYTVQVVTPAELKEVLNQQQLQQLQQSGQLVQDQLDQVQLRVTSQDAGSSQAQQLTCASYPMFLTTTE